MPAEFQPTRLDISLTKVSRERGLRPRRWWGRMPVWEFECPRTSCCAYRTYNRSLGRKRGFAVNDKSVDSCKQVTNTWRLTLIQLRSPCYRTRHLKSARQETTSHALESLLLHRYHAVARGNGGELCWRATRRGIPEPDDDASTSRGPSGLPALAPSLSAHASRDSRRRRNEARGPSDQPTSAMWPKYPERASATLTYGLCHVEYCQIVRMKDPGATKPHKTRMQ